MEHLIPALDTKINKVIQSLRRNISFVKFTYLYLYSKLNETLWISSRSQELSLN